MTAKNLHLHSGAPLEPYLRKRNLASVAVPTKQPESEDQLSACPLANRPEGQKTNQQHQRPQHSVLLLTHNYYTSWRPALANLSTPATAKFQHELFKYTHDHEVYIRRQLIPIAFSSTQQRCDQHPFLCNQQEFTKTNEARPRLHATSNSRSLLNVSNMAVSREKFLFPHLTTDHRNNKLLQDSSFQRSYYNRPQLLDTTLTTQTGRFLPRAGI